MNMLAYEADKAWNRVITFFSFKTLIQIYLLHSFIYSLTYCIKEGIENNSLKIKWKKCRSMRQLRTKAGGSLCNFFKTLIKRHMFCVLIFFTYCIIKGIKVKKFWRLIEKVLAYETYFLAWMMKKDGLEILFW